MNTDLIDTRCNKCGGSCIRILDLDGEVREFGGLKGVVVGGYASIFPDNDVIRFNMCEGCVKDLMDSFVLDPEVEVDGNHAPPTYVPPKWEPRWEKKADSWILRYRYDGRGAVIYPMSGFTDRPDTWRVKIYLHYKTEINDCSDYSSLEEAKKFCEDYFG